MCTIDINGHIYSQEDRRKASYDGGFLFLRGGVIASLDQMTSWKACPLSQIYTRALTHMTRQDCNIPAIIDCDHHNHHHAYGDGGSLMSHSYQHHHNDHHHDYHMAVTIGCDDDDCEK